MTPVSSATGGSCRISKNRSRAGRPVPAEREQDMIERLFWILITSLEAVIILWLALERNYKNEELAAVWQEYERELNRKEN